MKKNPLILVFVIFMLVGIIIAVLGVSISKMLEIPEERKETTKAIISDIERERDSDGDTSYTVWVIYQVDGKEYEEKLNAYSSSYREGKEIEVIYDKENPSRVGVEWGTKLGMWIAGGLGGVFALIGLIGLIVIAGMDAKKKKIEETGTIIYATYTGVEVNTMITVNGKHPYNITCSWVNPEDNKTYILKSENLYFNPEEAIMSMGLKTFPVYMDMNNKKNYSMDISAIKEAVVDLR